MISPADEGIEAARRDARTVSPAPETVTLKLQTMHGEKVHGFDGDHYPTETTCGLLIQPGDKVLPCERKVTCKKCLRILNREVA